MLDRLDLIQKKQGLEINKCVGNKTKSKHHYVAKSDGSVRTWNNGDARKAKPLMLLIPEKSGKRFFLGLVVIA